MKRSAVIGGVLFAATAVAAGAWWFNAQQVKRYVAAALPTMPAVPEKQSNLRHRLAAADAEAHSLRSARQGFATLAQLYHANGYLEDAVACYRGLEALEPQQPRWPHLHATILAGYGEIDEALRLWQTVRQLAPDYLPALLRIGDAELKRNHVTEAAAAYNAVIQRDPANPYAQLGLARIDFEAERWPEAQQRLEQIVGETQYMLGYDLIVSLYERTGQLDKARALRGAQKASGAYRDADDPWVNEMMEACVDPFRLALIAGSMAQSGSKERAVTLLQRAIELAPDEIPARFQLGTLYVEKGDFVHAREQFDFCTRLDPKFPDGWVQLTNAQQQLGELSDAERTLAQGLAHCPQSPGLHLMRGRNLVKAGATSQAAVEFRESIRLRPNEAQAYIELAQLDLNNNQMDDGVALLRQAIEAEAGNPVALTILAFYYVSTGDEREATRWCQQVQRQPRVPPQQAAQLLATYEQKFGHAVPAK